MQKASFLLTWLIHNTYKSNEEMDGGSAMNSYSGGGSLGMISSGMILACSRGLPEEMPKAKP